MKLLFILFIGFTFIYGQKTDKSVMRSLLFSPSATSSAKADNGVASPYSAEIAMNFNPAGLIFPLQNKGYNFGLNYSGLNPGVPDDEGSYLFAAGSYKLPNVGAFGLSIRYLSIGSQDITDDAANTIGSFDSYEMEISLGYAYSFTDRFSGGIKLSYLKSQLANENLTISNGPTQIGTTVSPSAFALDLGVLYHFYGDHNLRLGASISNLGSKMTFLERTSGENESYNIPTVFRLGFAGDIVELDGGLSKISGEIETRFLSAVGAAVGINFNYLYEQMFELRLGYVIDDNVFRDRNYFTTGIGFKHEMYNVGFSYQVLGSDFEHSNPSNGTYNFSVNFDLEELYSDDEIDISNIVQVDDIDTDPTQNVSQTDLIADSGGVMSDFQNQVNQKLAGELSETLEPTVSGDFISALIPQVFTDEEAENLVQSTLAYKKVDYIISGKIIMVVIGDDPNFVEFRVSHLEYSVTDAFKAKKGAITFFKDIKNKSLIVFNVDNRTVERCYTELGENDVYFSYDSIRYKYDRTTKKTYRVAFE